MLDPLTVEALQLWFAFAVTIAAVVLFAIDRIPLEVSAFAVVALLILFFHVFPLLDAKGENLLDARALLAGFANPILYAILSLLVIGQGLFQTGAIERPARLIARMGRGSPALGLAAALLCAGLMSGFLNNTPVVVIFIPIMTAVAAIAGRALDRVLMPLSFISILGGMTTLIGSSSNLIVAVLAEKAGMAPIGFFDFTPLGVVLAAIGALYVIFALPRLLPRPAAAPDSEGATSGRLFIIDLALEAGHPWIGLRSEAGFFPDLAGRVVRLIVRRGEVILRPFDNVVLEEGDVVSLAATREVLTKALGNPDDGLAAGAGVIGARGEGKGEVHRSRSRESRDREGEGRAGDGVLHGEVFEAVIAPGSRLVGLTLEQARRRLAGGPRLLALRRSPRMLRKPLSEIHLEAGDDLLVLADEDEVKAFRGNRDLLILEWSSRDVPKMHRAGRAIAIFVATIALAGSGLMPIAVAALVGALAMLLMGCLNARQAARAIDRRIFVLVGASFALAEALQATGGAALLAEAVVTLFAGHGAWVLLSALFGVAALLTNVLSNQATAAIMTPITVKAALAAGLAPEPFVYGLIFALNCSFATPIAYQTNMIVMGPGQYRFRDFLIGGVPLIVLVWLAYSLLAPHYFGL